jgi:FkbM family methyltransferase
MPFIACGLPCGDHILTKPARLTLAQIACKLVPPFVAQTVRESIYSRSAGIRDDYTFEGRTITGSRFGGTTRDYHAFPMSVNGFYNWRVLAVAQAVIQPGETVVEIGGNVGTETVGFSDIVGKSGTVHSFEPLPLNYEILQSNAKLHRHPNTRLHQQAVSDQCGTISFTVPPDWSRGSGHIVADGQSGPDSLVTVECVTLDSMMGDLPRVGLIHMDAEGSEHKVILGGKALIRRDQPVILLEASPKHLTRTGTSVAALYEELRSLGYEMSLLERWGIQPHDVGSQRGMTNWVCIPAGKSHLRGKINAMIKRVGAMPCLPGINPLVRW